MQFACGVIDTEMNGRLNEEERQDLMDEIPSGRFADPAEVAELALKLTDTTGLYDRTDYWNRWRIYMIDVHHIEQISQDCSLTEFVGTTVLDTIGLVIPELTLHFSRR